LGETGQLNPLVQKVIGNTDLRLRKPSLEERDAILLNVLRRIRDDQQIVGSPSRTEVWDQGWGENLKAFKQGKSEEALVPKFMRSNQPIRWQKDFYFPEDPGFEQNYAEILRAFVFDLFRVEGIKEIHEFGAGTGWNLLRAWNLLENDPNLMFVGSDFVPSSVELIQQVGIEYKAPIESRLFDMKNPDKSYSFADALVSGVFTFGSLEQLAGELSPMLDFLIQKKPSLVISIEPASETYDQENLEDFTAFWFQTQRGYSSGLIDLLKSLENSGQIRIERVKRLGFGSMMMEGYNLFIWRVL
jgi:hypothetical protein